ncbi:YczE/YyaS/YitT family protein [Corynebacterium sp. A21]|uniref:YczE/YyaS/YitT family protein n=1 Tax=Corynebacterium sp. A21 TaxID=3457318 RepID=UPI003FD648F1
MRTSPPGESSGQQHLARRWAMLLFGQVLSAFGIAFAVRSDLGTTSISSLPYVLSLISVLSLGTWTILLNLAFLLSQMLMLRRRFELLQLLQIPLMVYFGLLNDLALWVLGGLGYTAYWQQWALALVGIVLVGFGVAFAVIANTVMLAGDALVLVVTRELNRIFGTRKYLVFGYTKVVFDVTMVLTAVILSLNFLHGLFGIREGTVAAALLIGLTAKQATAILRPLEHRWLN